TSLSMSGLSPATTYYFRIRGLDALGYSPYSNTASATTQTGTAATFVKTDTTTKGNWKGVYGADGSNVLGSGTTSYPSYAQVSATGQSSYTWAASTTDVRALLKPGSTSDRIAASWFTSLSLTIDLNLTDGSSHQVALYLLDWDSQARSER